MNIDRFFTDEAITMYRIGFIVGLIANAVLVISAVTLGFTTCQ